MKRKVLLILGAVFMLSITGTVTVSAMEKESGFSDLNCGKETVASDKILINNNSKQLKDYQCDYIANEVRNYVEAEYGKDDEGKPEFIFKNYEVDFDDAVYYNESFIDVTVTVDMLYHGMESENPEEDESHILFSIKIKGNTQASEEKAVRKNDIDYDLFSMSVLSDDAPSLQLIDKNEITKANEKEGETRVGFENETGLEKVNDVELRTGITERASWSYSKSKAVNYALKHCTDEPQYSANNRMGSDCANFVSKCIHAGGIKTDAEWYPASGESWGSDNWIRTGFNGNGGVVPYMTGKGYFKKADSINK